MAITRKDIWTAADELDAEGVKPTLAAVRKRVGSGSYTTIHGVMTEWKANRLQTARGRSEPPPEAITERMAMLAGELWNLARSEAEAQLASERQRIEGERVELSEQIHEATDLADKLTQDNEALTIELAKLRPIRAQLAETQKDLKAVRRKAADDLHRATEKANAKDSEAIDARKAEREALQRAAKLEGQVETLQVQLAELTSSLRPIKGGKQ